MNREELITSLKDIQDMLISLDALEKELNEDAEILQIAKEQKPSAVDAFDMEHKESYIIARIGNEPAKPKGIIRLAIPKYLSKMKEYREALEIYKGKYSECEEQYYKDYADERNEIEKEEFEKIEKNKQIAERNYAYTKGRYEDVLKNIEENSLLSNRLKTTDAVGKLIEYFQDQRVDSLKEAINLYYEEDHRKKMEEFIEEQAKLVREAIEKAEEALDTAEEAAYTADQALSQANYAIQVAEEANDTSGGYDWNQNEY